jgi:hypothetical protein
MSQESEDFEFVGEVETAQSDTRSADLQRQINYLEKQITVSPAIKGIIGGGLLAYFLARSTDSISKLVSMSLGGYIGYTFLKDKHLSDEQRESIKGQIASLRQELIQLDRHEQIAGGGVINSDALLNTSFDTYPFEGKWEELIGLPTLPFQTIVFGLPKSGKSILCMQFADYLANNFGRVLYISSEEKFSPTLQKKVQDFTTNTTSLDFAPFGSYDEIMENDLSPYSFCFIDSLNFAGISVHQMEEMKATYPHISFVVILQSTKDGKFRGSQEYAHNCDVIITIDKGVASQRGRFQGASAIYVFDENIPASEPEFEFQEETQESF